MRGWHGLDQQPGRPPQETDVRDHKFPETTQLGINDGDLLGRCGFRIARDIAPHGLTGFGRFHPVALAKAPRGGRAPVPLTSPTLGRVLIMQSTAIPERPLNDGKRRRGDVTGTFPALAVFRRGLIRAIMQEMAGGRLAAPAKAAQSPSTLHRLFDRRKRQDQVSHPQGGPGRLHSHAGVQFPGIDADHGFGGNRIAGRRGQLNVKRSELISPGDGPAALNEFACFGGRRRTQGWAAAVAGRTILGVGTRPALGFEAHDTAVEPEDFCLHLVMEPV